MDSSKQLGKLEAYIDGDDKLPLNVKSQLKINIRKLYEQKMNIMITGATGCGKSSTINALFESEKAKVGTSSNPETQDIKCYDLGNLIIWDTPGLGDGKDEDARHSRNIINKLHEKDKNGNLLIDLVLVILDGSSRDLGTSYELINEVIIPNLGDNKEGRILVAINQADVAMKGRNWDYENNVPMPELVKFLEEKVDSVRKRIYDSTGVKVEPIYYSAGFKEKGKPQDPSYNLQKLLFYIVSKAPEEKRIFVYTPVNQKSMSQDSRLANERDYGQETRETVKRSATKAVLSGVGGGAAIGAAVAGPVGALIGGAIGAIGGWVSSKCYITTATCKEFGKGDDCYELTMFRNFRDNWLLEQPDGKELVERYYATAPALVEAIDNESDHEKIYQEINDKYLAPCLAYIEKGENESCKALYVEMVNHLESVYKCKE